MDLKFKTVKGLQEFKDVHLTIRNYYDLKQAGLPFENLQKICEEENFVELARMLEIILKKYGVEKDDIVDAPLSNMGKVVNAVVALTTEGMEDIQGDGEASSGE